MLIPLKCTQCGASQWAETCGRCSRAFVVAPSHLRNEARSPDDKVQSQRPPSTLARLCDVCRAEDGKGSGRAVEAGIVQRTCPACGTEVLSTRGL